jgi:hypothetical protein
MSGADVSGTDDFQRTLGDEARWVYDYIRGIDRSEGALPWPAARTHAR